MCLQRAKKVVSNSPGLVDFAIGLVNFAIGLVDFAIGLVDFAIGLVIFVSNLPNGQVLFFGGNSNYRRIVINPANQNEFWG